jgi:prepilin-type N-terminal cleavage/methylation domain-containing protein
MMPRSHESGFTLLELMIVVAIIAVLAIIAIPSYTQYIRKSHRADALQRMQQIALAQERFRAENPGYTTDWSRLGGDPDTRPIGAASAVIRIPLRRTVSVAGSIGRMSPSQRGHRRPIPSA